VGHERAAAHPAVADAGVEGDAAAARHPRQAGARAADRRARDPAVREGNRHPRRRHDGGADDPARRRGEQAVARGIPQGARARERSVRELPRGHSPPDHDPARARSRGRQQGIRIGCRGRQLPRYRRVAGRRRGRISPFAHLHHGSRAGVARRRRGEPQARRAGACRSEVGQGLRRSRRRLLERARRHVGRRPDGARARGSPPCSPTSCRT